MGWYEKECPFTCHNRVDIKTPHSRMTNPYKYKTLLTISETYLTSHKNSFTPSVGGIAYWITMLHRENEGKVRFVKYLQWSPNWSCWMVMCIFVKVIENRERNIDIALVLRTILIL